MALEARPDGRRPVPHSFGRGAAMTSRGVQEPNRTPFHWDWLLVSTLIDIDVEAYIFRTGPCTKQSHAIRTISWQWLKLVVALSSSSHCESSSRATTVLWHLLLLMKAYVKTNSVQ